MKVLILCGGRGVIDPETRQRIPKAMMQVGGRPLVWHVMNSFAQFGFIDFVLALGEGGEAIRRHFIAQHFATRDIKISSRDGAIQYLSNGPDDSWQITCVDTGINAMTGSRIARCRRYLEPEPFFTTYSDCLCSVDLAKLVAFHRQHGKTLTVTGVQPTSRFGTFSSDGDLVVGYTLATRLTGVGGYINGGFMAMQPSIFNYVQVFSESNLEREVFAELVSKREAAVYRHDGYWQAVDTERDLQTVTQLYLANQRPWLSNP